MLACIVTVDLLLPGAKCDHFARWQKQRELGVPLSPEPNGELRTWRGKSDSRDWERLIVFKIRDGWKLLSHRREFVDEKEEIKDRVEHTAE